MILLITAIWASSQTSSGFEPARIELGTIRAGTILEPTCIFRNAGSTAMVVEAIRPGCGCLRVLGLPKELPAESSHLLRLRLNTLTPPPGPHTWQVTVRVVPVNGEAREEVVTLHGTIIREVMIEPTALDLTVPTDEPTETVLRIRDLRNKPLRIVGVRSSLGGLTFEPVQDTLRLKIPPARADGIRSETVLIDTDDPTYPLFEIPLTIRPRAMPQLHITPEEAMIRFPQGVATASLLLHVRAANGDPVELTDVTASIPNVTLRWSPGRTPAAAIRVTLPRTAIPADGGFELTIATASPKVVQALRIRVRSD